MGEALAGLGAQPQWGLGLSPGGGSAPEENFSNFTPPYDQFCEYACSFLSSLWHVISIVFNARGRVQQLTSW